MTKLVIHLVHGTWGNVRVPFLRRSPKWFEPGHQFFDTLASQLGSNCIIRPFCWGWGANLQSARALAAQKLSAEILRHPPTTNHILIGHSHGGNVCIGACANLTDSRNILGVFTLATPFIIFRRSLLLNNVSRTFQLIFSLLCLTSIIIKPSLIYNDYFATFFTVAFFLIILSIISLRFGDPKLVRQQSHSPRIPVHVFRTLGDEASGALGISAPLNWLLRSTLGEPSRFAWNLAKFVFLYDVVIFNFTRIPDFATGVADTIFIFLIVSTSAPLLLFLLLSLLRMPLGWDLIFLSTSRSISAESFPLGKSIARSLRNVDESGMSHTSIYNLEQIQLAVVESIRCIMSSHRRS